MWTCKFCQIELEQRRVAAHTRLCQGWKNVRNSLTSDVLKDLYIDKQMSMPDIQRMYELQSVTSVYNLLKKFGIQTRTIAESMPNRNLKLIKTFSERYGQINPLSKNASPRIAMQQKLFENEGITNVFQREDVKRKCVITILQKYGVENVGNLPRLGRKTYTKQHKRIVEICSKLGFQPKIEKKLFFLDNLSYRSYDVIIENKKVLIESQGDFYHANPAKYKSTDLLHFGGTKYKKASEIWEYDAIKAKLALDHGYRLLSLWQSDTEKMSDDELSVVLEGAINDTENVNKIDKENL